MGVRRAAVIVRLVPVHRVKRLESITSVCGRSYLFRIGCRIPDGDLMIPQSFHTVQVHGADFLCRKLLISGAHGCTSACGMLRLYSHRRLLLRCQLKECLGRQIIQHVSRLKHFLIVAVDFLRGVDPFIAEIIGHLCAYIHLFRNVKHHDTVPHLLRDISVRMCFAAGSDSSSGSAVKIFSVLIMGSLMTERKERIIICSKCRTPHPDHDRSICHGRTSVQGAQHIDRFVYPFHDRITCRSFFLCSRRSRRTFREGKPCIELQIYKAVQLLRRITHPLR